MNEQISLGGRPVNGFALGDATSEKKQLESVFIPPLVGFLVGSIGGAILGSLVEKGVGTVVGTIAGGVAGAVGGLVVGQHLAHPDDIAVSSTTPGSLPVPTGKAPTLPSTSAASVRTYNGRTDRAIVAQPGEPFAVALEANASTGYSWRLDPSFNTTVITLVDQKYTSDPPPNCPGCTGFGGTETFTFSAVRAGSATLRFVNMPPGSPPGATNGTDVVTITVRV